MSKSFHLHVCFLCECTLCCQGRHRKMSFKKCCIQRNGNTILFPLTDSELAQYQTEMSRGFGPLLWWIYRNCDDYIKRNAVPKSPLAVEISRHDLSPSHPPGLRRLSSSGDEKWGSFISCVPRKADLSMPNGNNQVDIYNSNQPDFRNSAVVPFSAPIQSNNPIRSLSTQSMISPQLAAHSNPGTIFGNQSEFLGQNSKNTAKSSPSNPHTRPITPDLLDNIARMLDRRPELFKALNEIDLLDSMGNKVTTENVLQTHDTDDVQLNVSRASFNQFVSNNWASTSEVTSSHGNSFGSVRKLLQTTSLNKTVSNQIKSDNVVSVPPLRPPQDPNKLFDEYKRMQHLKWKKQKEKDDHEKLATSTLKTESILHEDVEDIPTVQSDIECETDLSRGDDIAKRLEYLKAKYLLYVTSSKPRKPLITDDMDVDDIIRIVLIHMNHKGHFDRIRKRVRDGLTLSMLPKDDSKVDLLSCNKVGVLIDFFERHDVASGFTFGQGSVIMRLTLEYIVDKMSDNAIMYDIANKEIRRKYVDENETSDSDIEDVTPVVKRPRIDNEESMSSTSSGENFHSTNKRDDDDDVQDDESTDSEDEITRRSNMIKTLNTPADNTRSKNLKSKKPTLCAEKKKVEEDLKKLVISMDSKRSGFTEKRWSEYEMSTWLHCFKTEPDFDRNSGVLLRWKQFATRMIVEFGVMHSNIQCSKQYHRMSDWYKTLISRTGQSGSLTDIEQTVKRVMAEDKSIMGDTVESSTKGAGIQVVDPVKLGKIPDVNQEILAEQQQQSKLLRKGKSRLSRRKPTEDKMLSSETEPYVPNLQRMKKDQSGEDVLQAINVIAANNKDTTNLVVGALDKLTSVLEKK